MTESLATPEPLAEALTGRCLCGAVSITLNGARPRVDACHCDMCRRWGGGPLLNLDGESFEIEGEEHVTAYRSSEWAERAFCTRCGGNLWYRFLPENLHSFLAGLFELPDEFAMGRQIFIDEKPAWYDFAQDSPKLTGAEVIAEAREQGLKLGDE